MVANLFDRLLLAASFAHVLLTLGLLIRLGFLRVAAVRTRQVSIRDVALSSDGYPEHALKVGKSFSNQFEIPMLFYFGVAVLLIFGNVTLWHVVLAWAFVALRYLHAGIHITTNNVNQRFAVYLVGVIVLTGLMLSIYLPILFGLGG